MPKLDEVYIQQELERILPHQPLSMIQLRKHEVRANRRVDQQREQVMKLILEVCGGYARELKLSNPRHTVFNCLACGTDKCLIHTGGS